MNNVLLFDIETVQNLVATFRLWEHRGLSLPHQNVVQEGYTVCIAWQWMHEKTIHSVSVADFPLYRKDRHNDLEVCKQFHKVISSAETIVTHNGDRFDVPYLNGRFLAHGLNPVPPMSSIDTKKLASRKFMLNSNRLDYLGKLLGVGRKIETHPNLWLKILAGSEREARKAITTMVRYNKGDVALLRDVFLKLRPYADNMPADITGELKCPKCGSKNLRREGTRMAVTRAYQRWQCKDCGGWSRSTIANPGKAILRAL